MRPTRTSALFTASMQLASFVLVVFSGTTTSTTTATAFTVRPYVRTAARRALAPVAPVVVPVGRSKKIGRLFESEDANAESVEETTGDVQILAPTDVPSLPADAVIDVYYVETSINALGLIGEVVEGYHTGLVFEVRDNDDDQKKSTTQQSGVPPQFTIEWYAVNFPFGAFLPNVVNETDNNPTGLEWNNEAYAFYNPGYNPERWDKQRTLVGSFSGKGFAEYIEWTIEYQKRKPGYQAFEVWDRPQLDPSVTRRWVESTTCATFAEDSLREMWGLGGKSDSPDQIIRRSYLPIVSRGKPKVVDTSDPEQCLEVREFYAELNKAARGLDGESLTTSQFIRLLADRLDVFYVYDAPTNVYRRIELSAPYFALANLYQPMSLPWQLIDINGDGKLDDIGAFAPEGALQDDNFEPQSFSKELADAAESVGELLARRLPSVVSKQVDSKITFALSIFAVFCFALIINQSFVIGLLFGVGLGTFGPELVRMAASTKSE